MKSLSLTLNRSFEINRYNDCLKIKNINYSYSDINYISKIYSSFISELNKKKRSYVAFIPSRELSDYVAILSSIYSGVSYVPIDITRGFDHFENIINDCNINILFTNNNTLKQTQSFCKKIFKNNNYSIILVDDSVAKKLNKNIYNKQKILKKKLHFKISKKNINPVYILFTSGSTGKPKAVPIYEKNLIPWINNTLNVININNKDVITQSYNLNFDLSVSDYLLAWLNGAKLCVMQKTDILSPINFIKKNKISIWSSVPTLISNQNKLNLLNKISLPSIKYSIFCGEPLSYIDVKAWKKVAKNSKIFNFYGPTEATIWISFFEVKKIVNNENEIVSIGQPFKDHQFKVINADQKNKIGELIYRGPQIFSGYYKNTIDTKKVLKKIEHNNKIWYHSGDLVRKSYNKNYYFNGRVDTQIKISGKRIEILEIEKIIKDISKIEKILIVPKQEKNKIEYLVAFLNIDIKDNFRQKIYKLFIKKIDNIFFPKLFIKIKNFPINSNNKVDRNALKKIVSENY